MKKPHKFRPLAGVMFEKVAPRIGARVVMEPIWGIVAQIIFKNGRKRYVFYSSVDINTSGASQVAKDKDYSTFFMNSMGYPTIPGKTFYSDAWAKTIGAKDTIGKAYPYAKTLGFPVIVKPNGGSQGSGVSLAWNKTELERAIHKAFKEDRVALVQKFVTGKDYRIVVLDEKVISVYQRIALNVVGDGKSSIRSLLKKKQQGFEKSGRDTILRIDDWRIEAKLAHNHMTLKSVPAKGQTVHLLDNANLSTGGDSVDVTDIIHPEFKKLAIQLTKDMGLRLCGVDLMVCEGSIENEPVKGGFCIIEINAAPGLDHYARSGKEQEKIVEELYLELLKGMEKGA